MANELTTIPPNERMAISTGIAIATPPGTYARIAPRSGLAAKHSIEIGAGVIDQDYRGEIKVILINHSKYPYQVRPGDRIAQLILEKILLATPRKTEALDETTRGNRGFGSTGYDQNLTIKIGSLKTQEFDEDFLQRIRKAAEHDEVYQKDLENDLENQSGLLHFQKRLRIPHNDEIKREILESEHDHPTAGHFGQKKTLEIISRNFYWPNMEETINEYVRTCDACQRNKSRRHAKYGLLQPLDVPYAPWKSISVDFFVALPESEGKTQIMVVVDRFTKMAHFVPLLETATGTDVARALMKEVWKVHGLPTEIVSDRETKWTGEFWKGICGLLDIKWKLSTAFHPQTNGQTERVNQTLETYIRTFINYDQDDWVQMLPLAEFAYNNLYTTATKTRLFYANYGFHRKTMWPIELETQNPASSVYGHWLKSVHQKIADTLEETKRRMGKYYDQGKLDLPDMSIRDIVMLNAKNIRTKRLTKKLAPKFYGPFKILEKIGTRSYRLELDQRWRIHNVFHISLIEPYKSSSDPQRTQLRPQPEEIEGEKEFEVEKIIRREVRETRKQVRGRARITKKLYYPVKWVGYPDDECTWEPGEHLTHASEYIEDFHRENPEAPKL